MDTHTCRDAKNIQWLDEDSELHEIARLKEPENGVRLETPPNATLVRMTGLRTGQFQVAQDAVGRSGEVMQQRLAGLGHGERCPQENWRDVKRREMRDGRCSTINWLWR